MKLNPAQTLHSIAAIIQCEFVGDENHLITGINEIHKVEKGDLVFVDHPKYYEKALKSAATTILIDKKVEFPEGKAIIISKNPFDDYNRLTKNFCPIVEQSKMIGQTTSIDETAVIYPNVFIGNGVQIGKNTRIYPGAMIGDRTIIGDDVVIGPNTTIGFNAFYYKKKQEKYDRMHTCGWVEIQSNVEIGANCTIDAGVSGNTQIGSGTKIDNMVHVGHDTVIGKNCLFAAHVGIAGCVKIEDHVTLWGQVGCASDITIHESATVLAQSGIAKDLDAGKTYFGSPCGEFRTKFREIAAVKRLPELLERM